ncbi:MULTISPECIES: NAD-dependent succinate-semialdehyde dehydrogenase [Streptomyces]|uniref:NAD-dependent succinate-semialdehyde dehydrogenase n=1 Tax=Streptomyces mordarskii TaxID=1226758 RepID=A0ABN1C992_9ACTN|nr:MULTISPECIES: NAD-dependent succinate-semialdehyde dehydrogenase [unclassified Streptomyces]QTI88282.1 NAD-dependent succinate-semialdehyde dehydrogenase [Streptomyces sp. AgN23]RSS45092.1 NAD-dependent succinate-semialdehyde dehydrogenase [Streptomyces sp. WAC05858]WTA80592.1 NAD-dependent succinate-semialdehyde dehydrogenase [Streptomyces antimycoticus]
MALTPHEQELIDRVQDGLGIAGTWEPASSGERFDILDPATGEIIKSVADATAEDAVRALDAAVAAQDSWAATAARERSNTLRRAFDLLMAHKEDFALLMSIEMGKPIAEARGEVNYGGEFLRWFSEEAVRVRGDYRENPEGSGTMVVSHIPVGPCYFITPWNFPLAMATRKIAPALAAGCTVVIKPAELTPLTTIFFAQLLAEAGLPAGVVNVVPTSNPSAQSQRLLSDPRLRKLSFTGSTPVGKMLLAAAAPSVLRTSMELGGNAPFLVFEDADLDRAVEGVLLAKFRNIGQACTAANRIIVHESVADEFARRVGEKVAEMTIGRGAEEGIDIGALVDERAVAKTARLVKDAVDTGAVVVTGGAAIEGRGNFFQPTVLDKLSSQSAMMREEIFGPVLGIIRFSTEGEAVKIANDTEYGLVSYVFTENIHRGHRMIEELETGMMGLNTGLVSNAAAPFGGIKQSGIGREGGFEGINEFLSTKYTLLPR